MICLVTEGKEPCLTARPIPFASSGTEPKTERNLASRYDVGLSRCKALSAIIGYRAVNNGPTIDTLPCVENEKKIRKPFQHHHPFTLRTFHYVLLG